ncbi:MAG: glycosyltransferase [Lentisphaeria bacterium]|nr:glycosyltransferase [Lentisphaeria bacterium]
MELDPITQEFVDKNSKECSYILISKTQILFYLLITIATLTLLFYRWDIFLFVVSSFFIFWYFSAAFCRGWAAIVATFGFGEKKVKLEEINALRDEDLPMYTILVPMYKEAGIANTIIKSMNALDYPREKLDIKLLLEADDEETQAVVNNTSLDDSYDVIVVPDFKPKTKPRACNFGLKRAKGKYCVIFDAEDQPDPDQLKKVIHVFKQAKNNVACVQAKLCYFNPKQNLLTRWFTIEYNTNFSLLLPGLQTLNMPLPLGGTSNHFRTDVLEKIGGWDPFNVTEDCDLGIRLYKHNYKTQVVDSTTWEEANSELWNWIRQRSRWVKGFFQTHLTHMRHPFKTFFELGPWGFMGFYLMVGASSFMVISNIIFWIIGGIYLILLSIGLSNGLQISDMVIGPQQVFYDGQSLNGVPLKAWALLYFGENQDPTWTKLSMVFFSISSVLLIANLFFVFVHVLACIKRKAWSLIPFAFTMPIYWLLISIGGWKGFLQLFTNPFYWEKTNHGLSHEDGDEGIILEK